ncbi:MAG: type II toxin-antitoxin system prevent-host-death family antitoxin [Calditrichota bacterium]
MTTRTIKDTRDRLNELIDEAEKEVVQIRRNRKPVAAVMSWEAYESLMETLEILSDPEAMEAIRDSEEDIAAGRVHDWEEVKKELEKLP